MGNVSGRQPGATNLIRKSTVRRALTLAKEQKPPVCGLKFTRDGFTLEIGEPKAAASEASQKAGPSDADLDRELADWEAKRGDRTVST